MASHTTATLVGQVIPVFTVALPAVTPIALFPVNFFSDMIHGGQGRIAGTVREEHSPFDLPVVRRVRLHRKSDGMMLRERWSAPDGTYSFDNIVATQQYYVISFDHTGNYNAVIKDSITPEAMP